jgi:hypothetical protein
MIRIAEIRVKLRKLLISQLGRGTSLLGIQFCYGTKAKRNQENMASLTVCGWVHM